MKTKYLVLIVGAFASLGLTALCGISRSKNQYEIRTKDFTVHSHPDSLDGFSKTEYVLLKDGSEEVLRTEHNHGCVSGSRIMRLQNLDRDNTVDIIRVDEYTWREIFRLQNLLKRETDYSSYSGQFDEADRILLEERTCQK